MGASKYLALLSKASGGAAVPIQVKFFRVIAAYGLIQGMTSDLNVSLNSNHSHYGQ